MHVNWFIPVRHRNYNHMPASIWIRCLQLISYLQKRNVICTVNDSSKKPDISIFIRWQDDQAFYLLKKAKDCGQKIIFDLCVNYLDPVGQIEKSYGSSQKQQQQAIMMIESSDTVTCASDFIKQRASDFHPHAIYIPDSIDENHFKFKKDHMDFHNKPLTLIYSGVASKATFLFENLYPLIKKREMKLLVLAEKKPKIWTGYRYIKWRYKRFPQDIIRAEIGIAPRNTDNPYDKAHSIFKIGVFLAQGLPVLASPVHSYNELLNTNKPAGKICDLQPSWADALDTVLDNHEKLIEWSQNAYEVSKPYSSEVIADKYFQLFQEILA